MGQRAGGRAVTGQWEGRWEGQGDTGPYIHAVHCSPTRRRANVRACVLQGPKRHLASPRQSPPPLDPDARCHYHHHHNHHHPTRRPATRCTRSGWRWEVAPDPSGSRSATRPAPGAGRCCGPTACPWTCSQVGGGGGAMGHGRYGSSVLCRAGVVAADDMQPCTHTHARTWTPQQSWRVAVSCRHGHDGVAVPPNPTPFALLWAGITLLLLLQGPRRP